ncbi:MAG TPA: SPOR domain-containing protein [Bacteroidales bacterium]
MAPLKKYGFFLMKSTAVLLIFLSLAQLTFAQKQLPANFCISTQEKALFDKINQLRKIYSKKPLKLSASLSYVAKVHVDDLLRNNPDTSVCNLSSWSNKGSWNACCYNPYVLNQDCMWDKPKELTPYPYRGYEIAGYFEEEFTVDSVLDLWSGEKEVIDMLIAEGEYSNKDWVCMGVGMNSNYVSVWFGQRADGAGVPKVCSDNAETSVAVIAPADTLSKAGYYLIFGSFNNINDAREALKKYRKDGFENGGFLKYGDVTRVYLNRFDDMKEAMLAKQKLPSAYREAWIYKE